jgi:hypothetical protein
MTKLKLLVLLIGLGSGILYWQGGLTALPFWPQPAKPQVEFTTSCGEVPVPGVPASNGCNIPDPRVQAFVARFEPWLGEAVSPWSGRDQTFAMARLVVTPLNPPDWAVELANLGRDDLMREGISPTPGSIPHPALQSWLVEETEKGTDTVRLVGRILSAPICVRDLCSQFSDKQRFMFRRDATSADQVTRAPLGLWRAFPATRASAPPPEGTSSWPPMPHLIGAAVVIGILARLGGGRKASRPSRTV